MPNFYIISGNNQYERNNSVNAIIKEIPSSTIINYDYPENTISQILEDAKTIDMFSSTKIIIIKHADFFGSKNKEEDLTELESYLNNYNHDSYLIFTTDNKIDGKKKIIKQIKEIGKIIEVNDQSEIDVKKYVTKLIRDNQKNINSNDLEYLLKRVGTDINNINSELSKLFLIDNQNITREDIDKYLYDNIEDNVYTLINYITDHKLTEAITLYHNLLSKSIDLMGVIYLMANRFRLLYQVKKMYEIPLSNEDIAKKLMINPYRIKYLIKDAYALEDSTILNYLLELENLDKKIKTGKIKKELGLELFILSVK